MRTCKISSLILLVASLGLATGCGDSFKVDAAAMESMTRASGDPATQPPVSQPPVTQPPVTQPPVTQPPVTQPPVTQPPVTQPPVIQPPIEPLPPVSQPNEPTPTPTPTPTPLPCSSSVYDVFTYNSGFQYKPYFMNSNLTATQGRVLPVDGNGLTAFFSCVTFPGEAQSSFIIRTIAEDYVPATPGANVCTENLQSVFVRNGGSTRSLASHFGDATYSVAVGTTVTVEGSGGWILALKCSATGPDFTFSAVTYK